MGTSYLNLTGNNSLAFNPFKKKTTDLTTPQTINQTGNVKLNSSDMNKTSNPYGFSTNTKQGQQADLSPTSLIANLNKKSSTIPQTTPYVSNIETPKVDTTPKTTSPTALDNYMASLKSLSNNQIGLEKQNLQDTTDFETAQANESNTSLLKGLETLKSSLDTYTNTTNANLARRRETAETDYGKRQKELAKTRGESEARNRNRFAALNTSDSAGAGSFDEAQSNVESKFTSDTSELLRQKQNTIDTLEDDAYSKIQTELLKYQDVVRQVNSQTNVNNATKMKNIAAAKYQAQTNVNNILANLDNLKYQQLSSADGQLSEEFLRTGVPTTAAEYKFLQTNKDAFANITSKGSANDSKSQILNVISNLENSSKSNIGGITGAAQYSFIPGSKAALAKNYYDQLKGMLSLENRAKLKGSGAISDFESKTLERAASALDRNLSEDQFKQILGELKTSLGGGNSNTAQIGNYIVTY